MFTPGYYETNFRALRFRELIRMYGWRRALLGWLPMRFKRPSPAGWMPSLWADTECRREELSEQFWKSAKLHIANFERLGFVECGFQKSEKSLSVFIRDTGGIRYLDPTRRIFGQLLYNRIRGKATGADIHRIIIAFTAAFPRGMLSCTNHRQAFDTLPENEVTRLRSHDVNFIHQEFLKRLSAKKETPREFPDQESLRRWYDALQIAVFEDRARRRLFLPMTEPEVAAARFKLTQAKSGKFPPLRPKLRLGWWPLVILAIIALQYLPYRPHSRRTRDDTMEYRGQEFKLRKAYATYEDYKDDPDNLDTNELDRIEQAMTSAKVPTTFKDRRAFIDTLMDLAFPGYGAGGLGETAHTDDGSVLQVESVEIPQRDKERYLVVHGNGGGFDLVDDFVSSTATNAIQHVILEKQVLHYYDAHNDLVREKHL